MRYAFFIYSLCFVLLSLAVVGCEHKREQLYHHPGHDYYGSI